LTSNNVKFPPSVFIATVTPFTFYDTFMMGKLSSTKEKYQAAQMRKEPTRRRVPVFSYSKII
jgi:hypothetical protein